MGKKLIPVRSGLTQEKDYQLRRELIVKHCPNLSVGKGIAWSELTDMPTKAGIYYVYLLLCRDGTVYTGQTHDLRHRFIDHVSGNGAKYTQGREPLCVLYYEEFASRSEAMQREAYLKTNEGRRWRIEKLRMITGDNT